MERVTDLSLNIHKLQYLRRYASQDTLNSVSESFFSQLVCWEEPLTYNVASNQHPQLLSRISCNQSQASRDILVQRTQPLNYPFPKKKRDSVCKFNELHEQAVETLQQQSKTIMCRLCRYAKIWSVEIKGEQDYLKHYKSDLLNWVFFLVVFLNNFMYKIKIWSFSNNVTTIQIMNILKIFFTTQFLNFTFNVQINIHKFTYLTEPTHTNLAQRWVNYCKSGNFHTTLIFVLFAHFWSSAKLKTRESVYFVCWSI